MRNLYVYLSYENYDTKLIISLFISLSKIDIDSNITVISLRIMYSLYVTGDISFNISVYMCYLRKFNQDLLVFALVYLSKYSSA